MQQSVSMNYVKHLNKTREHELLCELSSQVQQLVHSSRHSAPNVIHALDAIMANQNLVQAIAEEKTKECEALYQALNTITHRDTEFNGDHGIYNHFVEGTDLTDYIVKKLQTSYIRVTP